MFITALRKNILLADPSLKDIILCFSGHSFRIAAATLFNAMTRGGKVAELKLLGDWNSDVYEEYIRESLQGRLDISLIMGKAFDPLSSNQQLH